MQSEVEDRSGFLFNVNLVFLSQIAIYGLAFGIRVLLARGLGDEGQAPTRSSSWPSWWPVASPTWVWG